MKKPLALALALLLVLPMILGACSGGAPSSAPESESEAVSSETNEENSVPEEAAGQGDENALEGAATSLAEGNVMLAAAASLENAFTTELIPMFSEQYPNIAVEGTYDSSGKLQTQIEEGLAADIFFSAATKQMDALAEEGYVDVADVVELLENEIVLIVPAGSDSGIASFEDIVNAETVAIGDPESVPAGQYAEEALTSLGLWNQVQAKASLGTNVTEVLNWVAEGSADAGLVYATDAAQMPGKVKVVAAAPEGSLAKQVIYPVAVLADAPDPDAAQAFFDFLQTSEAMAVFEAAGFKAA